jgi:uncharacterized membrane protein YphA (DoxX/SURF4 family)
MSIFFKAHGTPSIGLLFIRLIVGAYTLSLGIMQASNVEAYIAKVKAMQIVSENTAFILGFATPFLLIIFGGLYIMGFFTPTTSFILGLISIVKVFSRGLFPTEGIPFNKDLIFFACFALTLFAGAGVISFDALLDRRKKKVIVPTETKNVTVTAEIISDKKPVELEAETITEDKPTS